MNLDNTYLRTLNKDELIELLLLINSETIKDKRQILSETIEKYGKHEDMYWINLCANDGCKVIIEMEWDLRNFGGECEICKDVYCEECEPKRMFSCTFCGGNPICLKNCKDIIDNTNEYLCKNCVVEK